MRTTLYGYNDLISQANYSSRLWIRGFVIAMLLNTISKFERDKCSPSLCLITFDEWFERIRFYNDLMPHSCTSIVSGSLTVRKGSTITMPPGSYIYTVRNESTYGHTNGAYVNDRNNQTTNIIVREDYL